MQDNESTPKRLILDLINEKKPFTDIHLRVNEPIRIRMPDGWRTVSEKPIEIDEITAFMNVLHTDWDNEIKHGALNLPYQDPENIPGWRIRVNAFLAGYCVTLSIRRIPVDPPEMREIGLPPTTPMMLSMPRGLILVSGATGSGKSTTMASMIRHINESRDAHVVTVEDPIEYIYKNKRAFFSQREVGADVVSYDVGVEDAMRQRPDVIVIGEIRDAKTASAALRAGESGHLVIASLHANSAVGTISKIFSFFDPQELEAKRQILAGSLVGIINQILLPRKDGAGYALAAEMLFNHKGQFSKQMNELERMQKSLDQREDGISSTMVDAMFELAKSGTITKQEALRSIFMGQATLYEKLKTLPN